MFDVKDVIDLFVEMRFRLWSMPDGSKYCVYENTPEEGEGVSRRIFDTEFKEEAERFLLLHMGACKTYLKQNLKISGKQELCLPKAKDTKKVMKNENRGEESEGRRQAF